MTETSRVEDLLFTCLEVEPSARRPRLEELCASHPEIATELRRQFEQLVRLGFLDHASAAGGDTGLALPEALGPYRIECPIGRGGMGIVYRARQTNLGDRTVALKMIRPELVADPRAEARFVREALLASRLDHPNICAVLDVGRHAGLAYIVMQHVEGRTLVQALEAARLSDQKGCVRLESGTRNEEPKHAWRSIVALIEKLARALHAAHCRGLVHRDVKPGNIMVRPDGEPVLLDFGLARETESMATLRLTLSGELVGTPAYMAPEQIAPRGRAADARTDIFALAVTLYECLTLHLPHEALDRNELLRRIVSEPATPVSQHNTALPGDLALVLEVALDPDPERRYASALLFAEDLQRLRQQEPVLARRPGAWTRGMRWTRRNRVAAAVIASLAAGLAVAMVLLDRLRAEQVHSEVTARIAQSEVLRLADQDAAALDEALQAWDLEPSARSLTALQATVGSHERMRIEGLPRSGGFLAVSPTADAVVAFGEDIGPHLFRLDVPGEKPVVVDTETNFGRGVEWLPDGSGFVTASKDGCVRRWRRDGSNAWTSAPIARGLLGLSCRAEANGQVRIAVGGNGWAELDKTPDGNLAILDADTGAVLHSYDDHVAPYPVGPVRWIDGDRILFGTTAPQRGGAKPRSQIVGLLDLRTGQATSLLDGVGSVSIIDWSEPSALGVAFSRTASELRLVRLDGQEVLFRGPQATGNNVQCVQLSPDGRLLALGTDKDVAIVDLTVDATQPVFRIHHDDQLGYVAFSPDSKQFLTACADGYIRLFDCASGVLLDRLGGHEGNVTLTVWTKAGILSTSKDGTMRVWRHLDQEVLVLAGHREQLTDAIWLEGGGFLTAARGGLVREWDAHGSPLRDHQPKRVDVRWLLPRPGHPEQVLSMVAQDWLRVWDRTTDSIAAFSPSPGDRIDFAAVAFDSTGNHVLTLQNRTGSSPSLVTVYAIGESADPSTWKVARHIDPKARAEHAEFLPGGEDFMLACSDGNVRVFSADGEKELECHAHGAALNRAHASRDGTRILTLGADGRACLFDRRDGHRTELLGHRSDLLAGAFSDDGTLVATGDHFGRIGLWRTSDGTRLCWLDGHKQEVRSLHFSPDGRRLLSCSNDHTARVWLVHADDVVALARKLRLPNQRREGGG